MYSYAPLIKAASLCGLYGDIVARNRPENSMFRQVGNLGTTRYSEGLLLLRFVIPNRAQGLLFQKPKLGIGLGFVTMNLVLYSEYYEPSE